MFYMGVKGETTYLPETYPVTPDLAWEDLTLVMQMDQNNTEI